MKYGFVYPGSDPCGAVELAQLAEAHGWDGFFVWDSVWGTDPWVTLGAIAVKTEQIRMGTMITPVSRRRPWKLAGETATVDVLSNGRLILAVGLGAIGTGFANFGEKTDRKTRAELLDEGLEILTGLWKGQPFNFSGKHYTIKETTFMPPPSIVQQPRIPIWVVGAWRHEKSLQRVLKYDGLLPAPLNDTGEFTQPTPDQIRAMKAYIAEHRTTPLDIIVEGMSGNDDPAKAADIVRPLAEAGATWWLEAMWAGPNEPHDLRKRIKQGPPR